jgi:predicted HTH domain antitoxin
MTAGTILPPSGEGKIALQVLRGYVRSMQMTSVDVPSELVSAAGLDAGELSAEMTRLLALELYRNDRVSLGRAAELCRMTVAEFMDLASRHDAPMHYGAAELEEDRRTLERLGL